MTQPAEKDPPLLDAFLGWCIAAGVLVGLVGFFLGWTGALEMGGAVQLGFFLGVGVFAAACTFAPTRCQQPPMSSHRRLQNRFKTG